MINSYILIIYICFKQKNAKVVSIDGYEDVPVNDESALQKAVSNQPIAVAIEAGGREFQFYTSVIICTYYLYICTLQTRIEIGTRVNFCVNFDVYRVFSLVHVELIWTMVCWPLVTGQKVVKITG